MRTREIEVWVRNDIEEILSATDLPFSDKIFLKMPNDHYNCLKARLIIELPQRKVVITESQFDYAFKFCVGGSELQRTGWLEALRKQLFGDSK